MIVYTARRGDTLQSVAGRFSVDARQLERINGLSGRTRLAPGLALAIPRGVERVRTQRVVAACARCAPSGGAADIMRSLSFFCPCRFSPAPDGAVAVLPGDDCVPLALSCAAAPLLGLVNLDPNGVFSPAAAHGILCDAAAQDKLLEKAHALADERGFRGLYLEFGYLYPFDRAAYSAFARRAAQSMHRRGRLFVCAGEELGGEADDADFAVLLCCDRGYELSSPRPISPLDLMRAALEKRLAGADGARLLLGFSWRGCSWELPWRQGRAASALPAGTAAELAVSLGAEIIYDPVAAAARFNYTDPSGVRREIWFDELRGACARFALVDEYSLGGVCYRTAETLSFPLLYAQQAYFETAKYI